MVSQYGVAASAFGIGAAKANGQFDQYYQLATEALVASWPLMDGTLLLPKLLSNLSDAPYLGESALLFSMTRKPLYRSNTQNNYKLPFFVFLCFLFYCGMGLLILRSAIKVFRSTKKSANEKGN